MKKLILSFLFFTLAEISFCIFPINYTTQFDKEILINDTNQNIIIDEFENTELTSSDIISLLAFVISGFALFISYLTFRRDKKKANQDLLFHEKINAYKDISFEGNKIFREFFDLINFVQNYKGDKKNWEKEFFKFSGEFYGKAYEFEYTISKYVVIIPSEIYKACSEYSFTLAGYVTTSMHCNSGIIGNTYDKLGIKLEHIIKLIRDDLNVDKLNLELSKRIN